MKIIDLLKTPPEWLAVIISAAAATIGIVFLFALVELKNFIF